jgi:hypothetical protein
LEDLKTPKGHFKMNWPLKNDELNPSSCLNQQMAPWWRHFEVKILPYCFTKKRGDWRHVFVSLQSMSATSGGSSSFVRLSDNEISKILSIPMSLVSENRDQSAQVQSEQAKNPNVNVSSAGSLCDNTQRNLLHLNKVVTYYCVKYLSHWWVEMDDELTQFSDKALLDTWNLIKCE